MMQNTIPSFHFNTFSNSQSPLAAHELIARSLSTTSTSDEADADERRQRRMISNRESARRSRMRKQKYLDELWSRVIRLRNENRTITDKLNHVSECHDQVVRDNARLKEEASELRRMAIDVGIGSPFSLALTELEEVPCNTAYLRAESTTNQSITNSVNLLY
ncbi:chaperonin 60 subunit beta 4 [Hibiscus syriacus]|uniref:Chaperonin 60 subunit beta 4 n=1 Tax=Hibiscus syriacus TaxID=106335 RepID=A0A6A2WNR5_HIBSY|nr:chaperonin 60 subunit beta 4 [Hibiscus syriacus]